MTVRLYFPGDAIDNMRESRVPSLAQRLVQGGVVVQDTQQTTQHSGESGATSWSESPMTSNLDAVRYRCTFFLHLQLTAESIFL